MYQLPHGITNFNLCDLSTFLRLNYQLLLICRLSLELVTKVYMIDFNNQLWLLDYLIRSKVGKSPNKET